jgi:hypothetical protein
MSFTRREFLVTAGAVAAAAATPAAAEAALAPEAPPAPVDDPRWLVGDPHLAVAPGPGLGGGSFDALRGHALRFRTPAAWRDREALGVEIERA